MTPSILPMLLAGSAALFFIGMGIAGLAGPRWVVSVFGLSAETAPGRSEVRAVYGGFGVGVGALIFAGLALDAVWLDGVLLAFGVAVAGMAGARVAGAVVVERDFRWYPTWFFALVEIALAGALFGARGTLPP